MDNYILYIIYIILWRTIIAIIAQFMISKKGYDENWAIWGFLFGVIAIIIILVKPNVNQAKNASEKVWKCVFCKNVNSLSDDS